MKKLDHKGITILEIIISFVILSLIAVTLYNSVSYFNDKRRIESYKGQIYTYKNLLTKEIQDDFIKIGIRSVDGPSDDATFISKIVVTLKDDTQREFKVKKVDASSSSNSEYAIYYGKVGDVIKYTLPNLGFSKNAQGKDIKDLKIKESKIEIQDNCLSIYVSFSHPELGEKYAISIVSPINFTKTPTDASSGWTY